MVIEINFPNEVKVSSDLFGRRAELERIQQTLQSTARRPVVILGERKMGKSSLLNVAKEELEQSHATSVLLLPHTQSRGATMANIIDGICTTIGVDARALGLLDDQGRIVRTTDSAFVHDIQALVARRPGTMFVASINELDSMLEKCNDQHAMDILALLLYLIENRGSPLRFLLTMTQTSRRILRSYQSTFVSCATMVPLQPWDEAESCAFVTWVLKGRFSLDDAAQKAVFAAAGGHPYFTKAILQALLEQHATAPDGFAVTPSHVSAAVIRSIESSELELTLANISNKHFSDADRRVLNCLRSMPGGLPAHALQSMGQDEPAAAQDLTRRGYLVMHEGLYHIRIGIVARWLAGKIVGPPASHKGVWISEMARRVWVDGAGVELDTLEYAALLALARRAGNQVSAGELSEAVLDSEGVSVSEEQIAGAMRHMMTVLKAPYLRHITGRRYVLSQATVKNTSDVALAGAPVG